MNLDLFGTDCAGLTADQDLAPGAIVLRGFATDQADALLSGIRHVQARAPFRHLVTPGGHTMSVAMTNCGEAGWVSDRTGYRYDAIDPDTGRKWPSMPTAFMSIARAAAERAGFAPYAPDVCLINQYEPGARLTLHQDRDEKRYDDPIVSVSLGLPAVFLFGGLERSDRPMRIPLAHGDVVVWGGPSRLRFHGVMPLKDGEHRLVGRRRLNLTFRRAL